MIVKAATEKEACILAEKQNDGDYIDFDGQNCEDATDDCDGWNGSDRRCDCGNRRVSWVAYKSTDIEGEWDCHGEAY